MIIFETLPIRNGTGVWKPDSIYAIIKGMLFAKFSMQHPSQMESILVILLSFYSICKCLDVSYHQYQTFSSASPRGKKLNKNESIFSARSTWRCSNWISGFFLYCDSRNLCSDALKAIVKFKKINRKASKVMVQQLNCVKANKIDKWKTENRIRKLDC